MAVLNLFKYKRWAEPYCRRMKHCCRSQLGSEQKADQVLRSIRKEIEDKPEHNYGAVESGAAPTLWMLCGSFLSFVSKDKKRIGETSKRSGENNQRDGVGAAQGSGRWTTSLPGEGATERKWGKMYGIMSSTGRVGENRPNAFWRQKNEGASPETGRIRL